MKHIEDQFTGTNGVKIFYQAWRPDDSVKAVVQIAHGLAEHSGRYINVVNKLVPNGYAIYATDHQGHGKSEGTPVYIKKFESFAEDQKILNDIIKEKESSLPIFLLGHSMGSLIALFYVNKYSESLKGLILSGAGNSAGGGAKNALAKGLVKLMSKISPRGKISTGAAKLISRDPEVVIAYQEDPLVYPKSTFKLISELLKAFKKSNKFYSKIKLPTLIQCGSEDKLVLGREKLAGLMKMEDKTIKIYEGLKHEVYNEIKKDREMVLNDLAEWLDGHL